MSEREASLNHLKNLILLAYVDNVIVNQETQVVTEVMIRESLNESDFQRVVFDLRGEGLLTGGDINPSEIKITHPLTSHKSLVYLQDLVVLMIADGKITDSEKSLYINIAGKMGHNSTIAELMIEFVLSKLHKKDIEEPKTHTSSEEEILFNKAKKGAIYISNNFRELSENGYKEALILLSIFLVDLGTNHTNTLDMDVLEDRYFLLLHDYIFDNETDIIKLINHRVGFYHNEINKLAENPMYTTMFIYNALYLNPYADSPQKLKEFKESPITLEELQIVLWDAVKYMQDEM